MGKNVEIIKKTINNYRKNANIQINIPSILYKYYGIKDYYFNSVEEMYLYMARASELDDQFECAINFDKKEFLKKEDSDFYKNIKPIIKRYIKNKCDSNVKIIVDYIFDNFSGEKLFNINFIREQCRQKNIRFSEKEFMKFEKTLIETKNKINNIKLEEAYGEIFKKLLELSYNTSICSLSKTNMSQIMWQMYGDNYQGFCVEYDTNDILIENRKEAILPVLYKSKRDYEPLNLLTKLSLDAILYGEEKAEYEFALFLTKILVTKNEEWKLQNEWRIVGYQIGKHIPVKKINKIYLGRKMSEENIEKMKEISKKIGCKLYKQVDDRMNMTFKYIPLQECEEIYET